jgi:hypothetical protein
MDDDGKIQLNNIFIYNILWTVVQEKICNVCDQKHYVITNIKCDTNVIKQAYDIYSMISHICILIFEGFNSKY